MYESVCPLDDATVKALTQPLLPFSIVEAEAMQFSKCDKAAGSWHNYFVGIIGCLGADDDDTMWPNQVTTLCGPIQVPPPKPQLECCRVNQPDATRRAVVPPPKPQLEYCNVNQPHVP